MEEGGTHEKNDHQNSLSPRDTAGAAHRTYRRGSLCSVCLRFFCLSQKHTDPIQGPGDPINLLFIGSKEQITHGFQQASWLIPDPITPQTSARIAADSLAHRSYPTAPMSNLYVFGRVQDLAFEKPTTDIHYRGHIRNWKTTTLIGRQPAWIGAATYESSIELSST